RMADFVREETLHDKARVYVATEVDVRGLSLEEKDGRTVGSLQFLLVTMHRDTGEFFRFDQKLDLALPAEARQMVARIGLPIVRDVELGRGRYRAKIVVQDKATGKMGSVTHDFEVPDLSHVRVSTPVLSDLRGGAGDPGQGGQIALVARRDFAQGTSLYCQL